MEYCSLIIHSALKENGANGEEVSVKKIKQEAAEVKVEVKAKEPAVVEDSSTPAKKKKKCKSEAMEVEPAEAVAEETATPVTEKKNKKSTWKNTDFFLGYVQFISILCSM